MYLCCSRAHGTVPACGRSRVFGCHACNLCPHTPIRCVEDTAIHAWISLCGFVGCSVSCTRKRNKLSTGFKRQHVSVWPETALAVNSTAQRSTPSTTTMRMYVTSTRFAVIPHRDIVSRLSRLNCLSSLPVSSSLLSLAMRSWPSDDRKADGLSVLPVMTAWLEGVCL